jgi:hypothetical protein
MTAKPIVGNEPPVGGQFGQRSTGPSRAVIIARDGWRLWTSPVRPYRELTPPRRLASRTTRPAVAPPYAALHRLVARFSGRVPVQQYLKELRMSFIGKSANLFQL